jgi:hypothetical protein
MDKTCIMSYRILFLLTVCYTFFVVPALAQQPAAQQAPDSRLDKMPADLETAFALSALPEPLRAAATVYLLDPAKGLYIGRQGSNGFVCFVSRTEWEWGEFRKDLFAAMGFDPEGAGTGFRHYLDVAAMRASGKFTALQVQDSIIARIKRGFYKAPAREGVCYMLAPIMRVYSGKPGDSGVVTASMPHYMFYAPYREASDLGLDPDSPTGPWLVNPGSVVMGEHKGPYGLIIVPAREAVAAKIAESNKDLLQRLADWSPYFKKDMAAMHH